MTDHDHNHLGHLASDLAGAGGLMASGLAGAGGMLVSSVAAGLAVNSQWFSPAAATGDLLLFINNYYLYGALFTDSASCVTEAASASVQTGWPLTSDAASSPASICWRQDYKQNEETVMIFLIFYRRRVLLLGGAWGPWRYVNGNNVQVMSLIIFDTIRSYSVDSKSLEVFGYST